MIKPEGDEGRCLADDDVVASLDPAEWAKGGIPLRLVDHALLRS